MGTWFEGPYGPFCSKRCKLVDLGRWFSEEHLISKPLTSEDVEKLEAEGGPEQDKDSV